MPAPNTAAEIGREGILALAARVEAATGADRILDRDIEIAIQNIEGQGYEDPRDNIRAREVLISYGAQPHNYEVVAFSGISLRTPREYTASIDAVMMLIDPTWFFHVSRFSPESDGRGQAHIYPNRGLGDDYEAEAATPALALLSAALKARAVGEGV